MNPSPGEANMILGGQANNTMETAASVSGGYKNSNGDYSIIRGSWIEDVPVIFDWCAGGLFDIQ